MVRCQKAYGVREGSSASQQASRIKIAASDDVDVNFLQDGCLAREDGRQDRRASGGPRLRRFSSRDLGFARRGRAEVSGWIRGA